jgi:CRP-like cAMP-binding protein
MNLAILKQPILKLVSLSEDEWELFLTYVQFKNCPKGDVLLRQNEICPFICFILSGTVIYYQLTDKGEEIATDFAFEGDWVTDNRSRISQIPSYLNIKAQENTQVAYVEQQDVETLFQKIPSLERLGRLLIEQAFVKSVQLNIDMQILSAEERYQKLVDECPQVFQRLPLYQIANYLGIAPKSLSRIRNKKLPD